MIDDLAGPRPRDVLRRRRRVPEEIAPLAARAELAVAVDDVGLGQRPLHLQLPAGQEVAQLAAGEQRVARLLLVEEIAELAARRSAA